MENRGNGDGWRYPSNPAYQPYMVDFMEFFHAVEYERNATFSRAELLEIEPVDVKGWLANKAFHDPEYDVNRGDRPVHMRLE